MLTDTSDALTNNQNLLLDKLLATQLLSGEMPETIKLLLKHCEILSLKEGDILFKPGDYNNSLYIVLSGRLAATLTNRSDELLDYIETGSCVGEMSVLENLPVSAHVHADQDAELFVISASQLWLLIDQSKVAAKNLLLILSSRVRSGHKSVSKSIQTQRAIEHDAKLDALTGLYNRRWLDEVLPRWVNRNELLSIMVLDIDHFKKYNDTQGHLGGDAALKSVAKKLTEELRPTDLAARYGGEEFVTLLPRAGLSEAMEIAERIRMAIRSHNITDHNDNPLPSVTLSIGIAELEKNEDWLALLARADAALYHAKNAGRDCVSSTPIQT